MNRVCLLAFVIGCVFTACKHEDKNRLKPTIVINCPELRTAIIEYDSIIRPDVADVNYILTLYEDNINDTLTKYDISYDLSLAFFQWEPIQLAAIDNKDIVVSNIRNGYKRFTTDKRLLAEIAHKYFPEEYELLRNGKQITGYIINDAPWMELTFCRGKLVKKRMSHEIGK